MAGSAMVLPFIYIYLMSEIQDTCFKNFIGLSRTTCNCFGSPPSEYNVSLSNLYIDELEGQQLRMQDALDDCNDGSLWMFLYEARQQAVKAVKSDLIVGIAAANRLKRLPFQGLLGGFEQQSGPQLFDEILCGRRWIMNPIKGGKVIVKGVWVNTASTTTFNLGLYNNLSDTALVVLDVDSEAGKWKYNQFSTPMALPNFDPQVSHLNYYWIFSPIMSGTVYRNQIHCGCGGTTPSYDCGYPTFPENMDNVWNSFLMDLGVRGNVISDRANWRKDISEAYGLRFDVQTYCNIDQTICSDALNFESSEIPMQIAEMLQLKSGYYINSRLLSIPEPSSFTTALREQMERDRSFYFSSYNQKLASTVELFSSDDNIRMFSDCFTCRDVHSFRKSSILA